MPYQLGCLWKRQSSKWFRYVVAEVSNAISNADELVSEKAVEQMSKATRKVKVPKENEC